MAKLLDVNYDGAFFFYPMRYEQGRVLSLVMSESGYKEFHDYLEKETGTPFSGIYLHLMGNELENNLVKIQDDKDYKLLFQLTLSYGKQVVYLDHLSLDLTNYLFRDEDENGDKTKEGEKGDGVDVQCETGSESDENDVDYDDGTDDEDVESVASLDHLSEGEDELLELRKGNPLANIPLPSQLPQLGRSKKKPGYKDEEVVTIQNEHDDFMNELLEALRGDGNEPMKEDPFKVVEVGEKFPIHDPTTHWRLKRPQVSERYERPKQLKECLSYYALSNGFSLWYERNLTCIF